jgi:hypothetical protein
VTQFDTRCLHLGILLDPAFFEGAGAWQRPTPFADSALALADGWPQRFLPILTPRFPAGFEHACVAHMKGLARSSHGARANGLVLADSRWPQGHLAIGSYGSLVQLLAHVIATDYAKITPSDYLVSLYVDEDDTEDSLAYLSRPPSAQDIEEAKQTLRGVDAIGSNLDRGRAWALFAGDSCDRWSSDSALTEARQASLRPSNPQAPAQVESPGDPADAEDADEYSTYQDEYGYSSYEDESDWPECPDCGERRDPSLEYCWTCQCT